MTVLLSIGSLPAQRRVVHGAVVNIEAVSHSRGTVMAARART